MTVLSGRTFRRVSTCVQMLLMTLLVMLLFVTPLFAMSIEGLFHAKNPVLYWIPGYWFIGLYERLRPATGDPVLLDVGRLGVQALWWTAAAFLLTYLPGYRRHSRGVLETASTNPAGPGRPRKAMGSVLNRIVLRSPAERAVFHFMSQTIARSMKHRLFLATYGGFGAALGAFSLFSSSAGRLRLPLTLSFILVSGLRAAFNFPSELRANWVFQLNERNSAAEYVNAMRKWAVFRAIVPLFLLLSPLEFTFFSPGLAVFHLAYGMCLSVLLMDVMFFDFHKAPFACAYFPGKFNLVGLSVIYVFGFTAYSGIMSSLEAWLSDKPIRAIVFFGAAALCMVLMARLRARKIGDAAMIDYQGTSDPIVRTLGLASQ